MEYMQIHKYILVLFDKSLQYRRSNLTKMLRHFQFDMSQQYKNYSSLKQWQLSYFEMYQRGIASTFEMFQFQLLFERFPVHMTSSQQEM